MTIKQERENNNVKYVKTEMCKKKVRVKCLTNASN